MVRFALLFVLCVLALFGAELTPPVQHAVVAPWTDLLVGVCARLITLFDGHAIAYGNVLRSSVNGFAVSIEAGCNGIEAALVLAAAILAFRAPWKARLAGFVVGLAAVQALNVLRVVSLFYIGQWSVRAFDWAHLYLWQALIMLDVLVVWLLWLRWVSARGQPARADAR